MLAYFASFVSGILFGAVELCREHKRMKAEALLTFWGTVFLLGMGGTACLLLFAFGPRIITMFGAKDNSGMGEIILGILCGPLAPFALKKFGRKGPSQAFVSYHEELVAFVKKEVMHQVRIKRLELARKISKENKAVMLCEKAVEYATYVEADPQTKEEQKEYIQSCIKEGEDIAIALFLIDSYGAWWAKRKLMYFWWKHRILGKE